ncbi:Type 1 glutamine amidotransferase-like domain-containing protein [Clostridium sp. YIM B02515]|uniref:Type 1 glutamine amidotransferase-like domain-containing protein n=1 Tax=Clostridium rhizosphaerae TaxID=2803861 RepID=A0ABS1TC81_9CLOT|nr:Type 1 glutamine amidotransferase-like domain-containing protein [Clostridium rhizosphaerae]MBL4936977.1 Type 1 glutamine amidotransferase-like domain-containing protein [Clostridium rhizosphaerae]
MQKIILTSSGFKNKNIEKKFLELVEVPKEKIKVLFIPTAAITKEAMDMLPVCKNDLLNAGVLEENISTYDLNRVMKRKEICGFDAIYVCGGSSKHLLSKINEYKFYLPLKDFLDNGGVYIGVSAGSIVAAQNMSDNLGYINCILNVHEQVGSQSGYIDVSCCPNIKLTDNHAIVIIDDNINIIE